jgi:hypothetical protein
VGPAPVHGVRGPGTRQRRDAHINTARAAAGQQYRATFVFPVLYQRETVMVAGESHPFIVGMDGVQRYFTLMAECALASKLRLGAK